MAVEKLDILPRGAYISLQATRAWILSQNGS